MSASSQSDYSETFKETKCGVQIIKEWGKRKAADVSAPACQDAAPTKCTEQEQQKQTITPGIDIIRSFMNAERSEFGWPGMKSHTSSYARSSSPPPPRRSARPIQEHNTTRTFEETAHADDSWRRETDFDAHATPQAPPLCKFFASASGCRFGSECHFSHGDEAYTEDYVEAYETVEMVAVCAYFASGCCHWGDQCAYAHLDENGIDVRAPAGGFFECEAGLAGVSEAHEWEEGNAYCEGHSPEEQETDDSRPRSSDDFTEETDSSTSYLPSDSPSDLSSAPSSPNRAL